MFDFLSEKVVEMVDVNVEIAFEIYIQDLSLQQKLSLLSGPNFCLFSDFE